MKFQIRENLKKWWILVVVATLALSLTSCGKKSSRLMSGEFLCTAEAGRELGEFSLITLPFGSNQYQVKVYFDNVYYDTDISIALFNQDDRLRVLIRDGISPNNSEYSFVISSNDLNTYDTVQIVPSGQDGSNDSPNYYADCDLPWPGDQPNDYY